MQYFVALIFSLFSCSGFTQSSPTIRSDRPGQSISPYVVGENFFQLQSGIGFQGENNKQKVLNNFARFGLSEKFEVSGGFDLVDDDDQTGVDNSLLGVRYSVYQGVDSFVLALSLQYTNTFKGSGEFEKRRDLQTLITSVQLASIQNIGIVTNFFLTKNEFNELERMLTLNLGYDLSERVGIFVEPYSRIIENKTINSINSGLSFLYQSNLAFDFSFGSDLPSVTESRFVSFGFSFRQ